MFLFPRTIGISHFRWQVLGWNGNVMTARKIAD